MSKNIFRGKPRRSKEAAKPQLNRPRYWSKDNSSDQYEEMGRS